MGNRADGARSSRLLSEGLLRIGAAIVLTSPFVPMLFQGEEWGASTPFFFFTDYSEKKLAQGVREGRCREFAAFGWKVGETADPQARATFDRSKLNWEECSRSPHFGLLDWYCRLIHLRRAIPALTDGHLESVRVRYDEQKRWLEMERGPITVTCNLSPSPLKLPLRPGKCHLLLASEPKTEIGHDTVGLPPESIAILSTANQR